MVWNYWDLMKHIEPPNAIYFISLENIVLVPITSISVHSVQATYNSNLYAYKRGERVGEFQHHPNTEIYWKFTFLCWFLSKPRWFTQVWSDFCCQHGGRGQRKHHERWGRLHGGRQNHRQRADPVQVNVWAARPFLRLTANHLWNAWLCL